MRLYLFYILTLVILSCNESPEGDPEPEFTLENELELSELVQEEIFGKPSQYGSIITGRDFVTNYLDRVKDSILNVGGINNKDLYNWSVFLIDDSIQARIFAVPGGKVFLSTATLLLMEAESEMAALLAKEMYYIGNGLALNQVLDVYGIPLTIESFSDTNLTNIPAMTELLINSSYIAENELKGDLKSVNSLCYLSYKSDALADFYIKIQADSTDPLNRNFVFYPLDSLRINTIMEESNKPGCAGNENYFSQFEVLKDSLRQI